MVTAGKYRADKPRLAGMRRRMDQQGHPFGAVGTDEQLVFTALSTHFTVTASDDDVLRYCRRLMRALPCGEPEPGPDERGSYVLTGPAADALATLFRNGEFVRAAPTSAGLVVALGNDVNRMAVTQSRFLTLHAGGVEHDGVGVILPASMESGKTTLTAGLVRAGLNYLTDEAVAFDWETHVIQPYPKPLFLDPGSWHLFPELEPHADLPTDDYKTEQWHVPPEDIRLGSVGSPCTLGFILFPKYEAGSETCLQPISKGEALVELSKNTFGFNQQSRRNLEHLASIVRQADCYRLPMGRLEQAVSLVASLIRL